MDSTQATPVEERPPSPEVPLTMTASTMLSSLPRDETAALASAGSFPSEKVVVRFGALGGDTPALKQLVFRIGAVQKFEFVMRFLRKKLGIKDAQSVFLYINSSFAPSLDEVVGNLHRVSEI